MELKDITIITRRELVKLFKDGFYDNSRYFWDSKYSNPEDTHVFYNYNGCLTKLEFLNKLNLDENFDLYSYFTNSDDKFILDFLCAVFNPIYRDENGEWKEYLGKVQDLLYQDGYELYRDGLISNKEIYNWRKLTKNEKEANTFLPFSIRYDNDNIQKFKITLKKRKILKELFLKFELEENLVTETNWHYTLSTRKVVVNDLKDYYQPKAYNSTNQYVDEEDFDNLVMYTSPKSLFDIIELFSKYKDYSFEKSINEIIGEIGYELKSGKIMFVQQSIKAEIPYEPTLKELIQLAEKFRLTNSIQTALEKIWDAFECMKTYYSEDKKDSCDKIINLITLSNPELYTTIEEEFKKLTKIGNQYQIRHFERGKIEIKDDRIKEYFYARCLALINLVVRNLENQ